MKITHLLTITAALVAFAMPTPASAGPNKRTGAGQRLMDAKLGRDAAAPYDKNGDKKITGDEVAEFKKAFDAEPTSPLKVYDTNSDGKLSDEEIATASLAKRRRG